MLVGQDTRDLQLYYNNSFLRIKKEKDGPEQWYYVNEIEIDKNKKSIYCQLFDELNGTFKWVGDISQFRVDTGKSQYYFSKESDAQYLRRRPVREAARGLSLRNSFFINPLVDLVPANFHGALWHAEEPHEYLKLLNNKDQLGLSLDQAKEYLMKQENCLSVPVQNRWCLSLSLDTRFDFSLWFKLNLVGMINKQGRYAPIERQFTQEVKDAFPHLFA